MSTQEETLSLEISNVIHFILRQRKKLGWNLKLPLLGSGAKEAMQRYNDRIDTEITKTVDDDGTYVYGMCKSDIILNILYSPYNLQVVESSDVKNASVYYTVSATYVTRVSYFIVIFSENLFSTKKLNQILRLTKFLGPRKLYQ